MAERGFTLVEVLVAFVMLALVLAAGYGAMGAGLRGGAAAERYIEALGRAESALARVVAPVPGETVRRDGGWTERLRVARHAEVGGASLLRVEAEVSWRDSGRADRRVVLVTLVPGGVP